MHGIQNDQPAVKAPTAVVVHSLSLCCTRKHILSVPRSPAFPENISYVLLHQKVVQFQQLLKLARAETSRFLSLHRKSNVYLGGRGGRTLLFMGKPEGG